MKVFRRFSSHFAFLPDGTLGKWPVVEITNNGEIISISVSPDGFKEQPSLEFHRGILIPGLVDACIDCHSLFNDKRNLNRHLAGGTVLIGCHNKLSKEDSSRVYPPFVVEAPKCESSRQSILSCENSSVPIFERMKDISGKDSNLSLHELLFKATVEGAEQLGMTNIFGLLKPGLFAGLVVLEQIDLQNLKLLPQSRARWLVQPKNILL